MAKITPRSRWSWTIALAGTVATIAVTVLTDSLAAALVTAAVFGAAAVWRVE